MTKLKLIRGRTYIGCGIKVSALKPFIEVKDKETADYLVESKRFMRVSDEDFKNAGGSGDAGKQTPQKSEYDLLKEKATALGLEFKGSISKADLTKLIEEKEKEIAGGAGGNEPNFDE